MIVFPHQLLERAIQQDKLSGFLIPVRLRAKGELGTGCYVAYVNNLKKLRHYQETDWSNISSSILIDGQNLIGAIEESRCRVKIGDVISRIQALAPKHREVEVFLCSTERHNFHSQRGVTFIERGPKYINDGNRRIIKKTDADTLMMPRIVYTKLKPAIKGLVIFTGDSDFKTPIEMVAGIGEYKPSGQVPVMIISGARSLSAELRALGNYPHVKVVELEDLI